MYSERLPDCCRNNHCKENGLVLMESKSSWGGARDGAGRPTLNDEKRDRNIGIRVSASELEMFKEKAKKAGMSLTEFIIDLVKKSQ